MIIEPGEASKCWQTLEWVSEGIIGARMERGDFWQVHDALPEALVDAVLEFGQPQPGQAWWDLYAGAGLFAAFLGEAVGTDNASGASTRCARPARSLSVSYGMLGNSAGLVACGTPVTPIV